MRAWKKLLRRYSEWLQGIYLRLHTQSELAEGEPYKLQAILAVPHERRGQEGWRDIRADLERDFSAFWEQFSPAIKCSGVEALGTDEITLVDLERYQRFDADWVSFEDDSPTTNVETEITS